MSVIATWNICIAQHCPTVRGYVAHCLLAPKSELISLSLLYVTENGTLINTQSQNCNFHLCSVEHT